MVAATLADRVDAALPQTQCTRCGYPDCRRYAEAIAAEGAAINRCPPGGTEGVRRLAAITGAEPLPLDPACGSEGPLALAVIDEAWCIGCTLCLAACPVDAIVGAPKLMHTVVAAQCTGCALCLPVCPVDCIAMPPTGDPRTGWQAWSEPQAEGARERYRAHQQRMAVAPPPSIAAEPMRAAPAASQSEPDAARQRALAAAAQARARVLRRQSAA